MAVSSEFILAPRIDEKKMRQESEKMQSELRRSSKQAADDFEHWFGRGFERATDKGVSGIKSKMKNLQTFMSVTAANLASEAIMAVGSAAKQAVSVAFQGAEEYAQIAKSRINNISDISDTADALGINRGRYAALSAAGISARLEQSDIQGILSGFVGALERPEMALYKDAADTNGIENAFLDFIGTMSKMKSEEAAQYMNQVFGDSDALKASRFMRPFKEILEKGGDLTFENIVEKMFGGNIRIEALERALYRNDSRANIVSGAEARSFLNEIMNGVTYDQAKNVVDIESSESRRVQAHLEALDLKAWAKIQADDAEIAAVKGSKIIHDELKTFSEEFFSRWDALVNASNGSAASLSDWKVFSKRLIEFGGFSPLESVTGKSLLGHAKNYMDKEGEAINRWMVEIAERENNAQKNRRDSGPLK